MHTLSPNEKFSKQSVFNPRSIEIISFFVVMSFPLLQAWKCVSGAAKQLCKGLLTVNPRKRLTMEQLREHPWLAVGQDAPPLPLMTPSLLIAEPSTERCIKQTYDAFHNATREGFRLFPVASSPSKLLQKRKLKQSVSTETTISSSSGGSDRSSFGSKSTTSSGCLVAANSAKFWAAEPPSTTTATTTTKPEPPPPEVFNFKGSGVTDYLASFTALRTAAAAAATPFNLPLSVQVNSAYSSHHHHTLPPPPHLLSYPQPSSTFPSPFHAFANGGGGVSLSIISPPVISSSAASSPASHTTAATDGGGETGGPLTRSRKRKLGGGDQSTAGWEPNLPTAALGAVGCLMDLKVARKGTITIE